MGAGILCQFTARGTLSVLGYIHVRCENASYISHVGVTQMITAHVARMYRFCPVSVCVCSGAKN